MTLFVSIILRWLEKRMDGNDRYKLASVDPLAPTAGTLTYHETKGDE